MKQSDLRVVIPKRFKENLSSRFNPKNAIWDKDLERYIIFKRCSLCAENLFSHRGNCKECPFYNLHKEPEMDYGCFDWMRNILGKKLFFSVGYSTIIWSRQANQIARKQLVHLHNKAQTLITFK